MKTDAVTFRRLLPALEWMAHFPKANLLSVCERRKCNADEVLAAINDMVGGLKHWDPDMLAEFAGKLGVEVPPFQPALSEQLRHAPLLKSKYERMPAGSDPLAPKAAPAPAASAPARQEKPRRSRQVMRAAMASVVRELLKADGRSTAAILRDLKVAEFNWYKFKRRHLGKGEPTAEALQALLVKLEGKPAAAANAKPLATAELPAESDGKQGIPGPTATPAKAPSTGFRMYFTGGRREGKTDTLEAFLNKSLGKEWPKAEIVPASRDTIGDLLNELVDLAEAFGRNRDRGVPVVILRRALIAACEDVTHMAAGAPLPFVAGGDA